MIFYFLVLSAWFNMNEPKPQFEAQTIDSNVSIGYGLALGDVDGDKKPDILLADKKQFVWYRNGDWKRFVMAENLTEFDNVCIAAEDIDGDGKVEVAVGAQWNPSETSNAAQSGSVHYLVRPADPTQKWEAVQLHHEPTVHRMRWALGLDNKYYLVVLPLHGVGNKGGEGQGVKVLAYEMQSNVRDKWKTHLLDSSMHLTHNFDIASWKNNNNSLLIGGKEGIRVLQNDFQNAKGKAEIIQRVQNGAGEIRVGKLPAGKKFIATVEPMHGQSVVVYLQNDNAKRIVLDDAINEGHALATADFFGIGSEQLVAGWRNPGKDGKTGIKIHIPKNKEATEWQSHWIDDNGIACEDIQVRDLNDDGKPDIIASGRSSHNLKIYWNRSGASR
jgi:hypothetical protein